MQFDSVGLSSLFTAMSDSDENAVTALYHNTICANTHNKLWNVFGRPLLTSGIDVPVLKHGRHGGRQLGCMPRGFVINFATCK